MLSVHIGGELTRGNAGWITDDRCWCHSVQISYRVQLGKSTFYLEKRFHLKKVSWFFFFSHSLLLYLKCAPLSLYFFSNFHFFFLFYSISLQEADWPDINSKLLVCTTNIHGGNVHNGQTRGLLWFVLDNCLAPVPCVFLCRGKKI